MNILQAIVAERQGDVAVSKARIPQRELVALAADRIHHGLSDVLISRQGTSIIAEMKKASPSAGVLSADYSPRSIASAYESSGAAAISVLTEPRHFMGDGSHLLEVRAAVSLPILRKDFMCDVYQLYEAAAWGADVVLLIVAVLGDDDLARLNGVAHDLGLDVLVEAHTEEELERALKLEHAIVGVNSRDLKTLKTDLAVAMRLSGLIPSDRLSIAESGIRTRSDIEMLEGAGYKGFLIGETLMRGDSPGTALRDLQG